MLKRFAMLTALVIALTIAIPPTWAHAASLRVCYTDAIDVDTKTIEFSVGTLVVDPDVLAGSVAAAGVRCKNAPFPATIARGQNHSATLRGVNAIGEGGPASAPVTFRAPAVPGQVTGVTVQAVAP